MAGTEAPRHLGCETGDVPSAEIRLETPLPRRSKEFNDRESRPPPIKSSPAVLVCGSRVKSLDTPLGTFAAQVFLPGWKVSGYRETVGSSWIARLVAFFFSVSEGGVVAGLVESLRAWSFFKGWTMQENCEDYITKINKKILKNGKCNVMEVDSEEIDEEN